MPASIPEPLRERVEAYFAPYPKARRIFEACLATMHMEPAWEWTAAGALRLRRWYPCIEVHPEPEGLRLHLDLYGHRKHARLKPVETNAWNELRLESQDEVDAQVGAWLRESLDIGNMK